METKEELYKQLQRAKAENERLKEWLEDNKKVYNRKKEQIKNLNYMLFEEKEMTTQEWKLKYKLANKERKFIQYKDITNKKLKQYKQTLEEVHNLLSQSMDIKLKSADKHFSLIDEAIEILNEVLKDV